MPQNPHVRTIRLFNPAQDLAVDNADPRRVRKRRPPVNPAEGLLNDDDDDAGSGPAGAPGSTGASASRSSEAEYTRLEPEESPESRSSRSDSAASSGAAASRPESAPAQSEKFESSVLGEVPDIIEGDFPEPVDL